MTDKAAATNRLAAPILHALRGEFRDAVTEIYKCQPEVLEKQHALRVESGAVKSGCTA
jgi:hypothetical protein